MKEEKEEVATGDVVLYMELYSVVMLVEEVELE